MAQQNNFSGVVHLVAETGRVACKTRSALIAVKLDKFNNLAEGERQCARCKKTAIKWMDMRARRQTQN